MGRTLHQILLEKGFSHSRTVELDFGMPEDGRRELVKSMEYYSRGASSGSIKEFAVLPGHLTGDEILTRKQLTKMLNEDPPVEYYIFYVKL